MSELDLIVEDIKDVKRQILILNSRILTREQAQREPFNRFAPRRQKEFFKTIDTFDTFDRNIRSTEEIEIRNEEVRKEDIEFLRQIRELEKRKRKTGEVIPNLLSRERLNAKASDINAFNTIRN